MLRTRAIAAALVSIASLSTTMGVASANGTAANETRAEFVMQLDQQLSIAPVYPTMPDYRDVPTTSPYYGYIEAATQKGFVAGIAPGAFGPGDPITRAEAAKILVEAYGAGNDATAGATTFTDNAAIPAALVGFVAEAAKLGLMDGFPGGSFQPEAYLTAAQEAHLIAHLQSTLAVSGLKISASGTDVAPGQVVALSAAQNGIAVAASYRLSGGNYASAGVSGSTFTATAPGTYTVTGTFGSASGSITIAVYGMATGLKITAPTSVVANGVATSTVSVSVVDANGNVVADNSDTIRLSQMGAAFSSNFTGAETAVAGVATFTLTSGTLGGATSTLTAADGMLTATSTVTADPQVATKLSIVAASPYITANDGMAQNGVSVAVLDQTGNPMLYGTWGYTLTASGPAALNATGGQTITGAYSNQGAISPVPTPVDLYSIQSDTGPVTISVSSPGLAPASVSVTAVITGLPASISATSSAGAFQATDSAVSANPAAAGDHVTISTELLDSNGHPAGYPSQVTVSVEMGGLASKNLEYSTGGTAWIAINGAATFTPSPDGTFMLAANESTAGAGAEAGSYTVTVSDTSATAALTSASAPPIALAETAGPAAKIVLTPAGGPDLTVALPITAPSTTLKAQLLDYFGNPVPESGVAVTFYGYSGAGAVPYTLGGVPSSLGDATYAATTADGVATATFQAEGVSGQTEYVRAETVGLHPSNETYITVHDTVGSSLTLSTALGPNETNFFQAGQPINVTATVTDPYGTPVAGEYVDFTLPDGTTLVSATGTNSAGQVSVSVPAAAAGTETFAAQDVSSVDGPKATASVTVIPGVQDGWAFYNAAGQMVGNSVDPASDQATVSVAANTATEFWLRPIDAYGNPVVDGGGPGGMPLYVLFSDPHGGAWRATAGGADFGNVPQPYTTGVSQMPFWYVNGMAQNGVSFDGDAMTAP